MASAVYGSEESDTYEVTLPEYMPVRPYSKGGKKDGKKDGKKLSSFTSSLSTAGEPVQAVLGVASGAVVVAGESQSLPTSTVHHWHILSHLFSPATKIANDHALTPLLLGLFSLWHSCRGRYSPSQDACLVSRKFLPSPGRIATFGGLGQSDSYANTQGKFMRAIILLVCIDITIMATSIDLFKALDDSIQRPCSATVHLLNHAVVFKYFVL